MSFKDCLKSDLATFINTDDFADYVSINGVRVKAVFDNSVANTFQRTQIMGVFKATVVVYLAQGSLDPLPKVGSDVIVNNLHYRCHDVTMEQGVDILTLEAVEQ